VLLQAERRGRITLAEIKAKLAMVEALPIAHDTKGNARVWRETFSLARSEHLTVYDASYLELALRKGMALASQDKALIAAAKRTGVAVLPD
jgi:predicted nucleic acid-binding protein